MARARKVDHKAVEQYAQQHPEATQVDIAKVFGFGDRGSVGRILRRANLTNTHRGVPRKASPPPGTWAEQAYFYWDQHLQTLGLGMRRGERLNGALILTNYDPSRQGLKDESATLLPEEQDNYDPAVEALTRPSVSLVDSEEAC
jgi:hypothetical protein